MGGMGPGQGETHEAGGIDGGVPDAGGQCQAGIVHVSDYARQVDYRVGRIFVDRDIGQRGGDRRGVVDRIDGHGKRVAVLIPVDDLAMLEALEDRIDVALAKKALKDKGTISWSRAKKKLSL